MSDSSNLRSFRPNPPDAAGVLSWVHIGDLHMRAAGAKNDLDLQAIVEEINAAFQHSISFVFLPGDNADHGDPEAYAVVRRSLDQLHVPWCAIPGDHDVAQHSLAPFCASLAAQAHYAFTVGDVRFLAMNAFDVPEPTSFAIQPAQLAWAEGQLQAGSAAGQRKVIFLHCYPSDLKQGADALAQLIAEYGVVLVDMGHTHYNEISHDGRTLYTATRSTGQIEEGPVGFSVTNLDGGVISWRFLELARLPAVIITSPSDERLLVDDAEGEDPREKGLRIRAKVWALEEMVQVEGTFGGAGISLQRVDASQVWEGTLHHALGPGLHGLRVTATDLRGKAATDEIRVLVGSHRPPRHRVLRDQDNALEAWPEHGLLGTQLGPNKNGKKW